MGSQKSYIWAIVWLVITFQACNLSVNMPHGDKIAIVCLFLNNIMSGWHGYRGFVDSRFCEPEQAARFQNANWILAYILGMFIGPIYAALFDGYATTYMGRSNPNFLSFVCHMTNQVVSGQLIYSMSNGTEGWGVFIKQIDVGSDCISRFFAIIKTKRPDKGIVDGIQAGPILDQELWTEMGLDKLTGEADIVKFGGPFFDGNAFGMVMVQHSVGPVKMLELLKLLDKIPRLAEAWAGIGTDASKQLDEKKKA